MNHMNLVATLVAIVTGASATKLGNLRARELVNTEEVLVSTHFYVEGRRTMPTPCEPSTWSLLSTSKDGVRRFFFACVTTTSAGRTAATHMAHCVLLPKLDTPLLFDEA